LPTSAWRHPRCCCCGSDDILSGRRQPLHLRRRWQGELRSRFDSGRIRWARPRLRRAHGSRPCAVPGQRRRHRCKRHCRPGSPPAAPQAL
jgi:hypothetical protein